MVHDLYAAQVLLVQLKRALRGAAFALGALIPLREEPVLDKTVLQELRHSIQCMEAEILDELQRIQEGD